MSKFYDFEAEDVMCNMHKMEEYQEQGFAIWRAQISNGTLQSF